VNESVHKPEVLFVCVQNAGRSQMAAALLKRAAGVAVKVRSAGSRPADRVHPVVAEAMAEIGIELKSEPTQLSDEAVHAADVVITMGCGDACPTYPGKRYEDWDLQDPSDARLADVRVIRDAIERRVGELLNSLV
jgi:protein-tyrosine-phosphatase